MDCPKCPVGKLSEVTVKINNIYREKILQGEGATLEIRVDQCFVCSGFWFDAGELDKCLSEHVNVLDSLESPDVDQALMKELKQKLGKCPRCQMDMVKKPAPKDSKMIIDVCEKCQGIWLDGGEYDELESRNLGKTNQVILRLENLLDRLRGKD